MKSLKLNQRLKWTLKRKKSYKIGKNPDKWKSTITSQKNNKIQTLFSMLAMIMSLKMKRKNPFKVQSQFETSFFMSHMITNNKSFQKMLPNSQDKILKNKEK